MIIGVPLTLVLLASLFLTGNPAKRRNKPRYDERKGRTYLEPVAEEPNTPGSTDPAR